MQVSRKFAALVDSTREAPAFVGLFERGTNESLDVDCVALKSASRSGDWIWIDGSNMSFETGVNETVPLSFTETSEPSELSLAGDPFLKDSVAKRERPRPFLLTKLLPTPTLHPHLARYA